MNYNTQERDRILIVDDDDSTRRSLSAILERKGFLAETARTGQVALEKAQADFFNIALLDIRLPDMLGLKLIEPLHQVSPDTIVIVVTGYASLETALQALNEGASGYITKPLNIDEVLSTIHQMLEKQRLVIENRNLYRAAQRELAERKRAERELAQRVTQLAILNDVGAKIAAELELDRVMDRAAQLVKAGFGYHHVALFGLDAKRGELVMRASAGDMVPSYPSDYRIRVGQGMIGWVAAHGKRLLANDVRLEPRYVNLLDKEVPTRAELTVPIQVGQETVGVIDVQSPQLDAFGENDVMVIETLADQIAIAIRNARLYETVQQQLAERVQAEEERERIRTHLFRSQKMEAIGRLAGGVAHDFNNLLTAITGYAELLLHRLRTTDPYWDDVQEILKAGKRAAALTGQLLAFSRRQNLRPKVLDLYALVQDMEKMMRRLVGEDIELVVLSRSKRVHVKADPSQLEQVILNLFVNARDAMPNGGKLTIVVEEKMVDESYCELIPEAHPGRFACLLVSDTGIGLDKEAIQHIFEPFYTTKEHGTGLGLAVVYGIVRQHKGWISVDSEQDVGTTFQVYLPALSTHSVAAVIDTSSLTQFEGNGERILLVEDEERVRAFAVTTLTRHGYEVCAAASAEEALCLFDEREGAFDMVFSDVVLPGLSGFDLIKTVSERRPDLPVLLSSGYTDQKSQWPAIQERGIPFLQKPYAVVDLLREIRTVLQE